MLTYVFIALLIGILVWRVILPGRKFEKSPATVATTPGATTGAGGGTSTAPSTKPSMMDHLKSNILSILVVVVGAVAMYWSFNASVRPADVGSWSYDKWLTLLIFWVVASILIAINVDGKTAATLQKVLAGVMLVLLVVLPIWFWIITPSAPSLQTQHKFAKPMLKMPPNGDSDRISPDAGQIVIFTGDGFEHHVIYADLSDCVVGNPVSPCKDGPILYQYVRDTTGKPNSVTYKFVR